MSRFKTVFATGVVTALAIGAFSATAAAADPAIVVAVHGIPGVATDLCVDNKEVKSNFRFGQFVKIQLNPGMHKVVLKPAKPGKCQGSTIMKIKSNYTGGENITAVAGYKNSKPGFRIFDNGVGASGAKVAAPNTALQIMHGARTGPINAFISQFLRPTAPAPFFKDISKGQSASVFVENGHYTVQIGANGSYNALATPITNSTKANKTNHYVLVGGNGKFDIVNFRTPLLAP